MNNFIPRVFELTSLYNNRLLFLLRVRAELDGKQFYLEIEIDQVTYTRIEAIVKREENTRYRMSLTSIWNPYKKQYMSSITSIKGSFMETNDFYCSKHYAGMLNELSKLQSYDNLSDIAHLDYVHVKKPTEPKLVKQEITVDPHREHRMLRLAKGMTASLIIVVSILFVMYHIVTVMNLTEETNGSKGAAELHGKEQRKYVAAYSEIKPNKEKIANIQIEKREDTYYIGSDKTDGIYSLPEGYAAITFDDGPTKYTKEIVDILEQYNKKATFFFLGGRVSKYPDSVKYASEKGMSIGNHSWAHKEYTSMSAKEQMQDLEKTNKALSSATKEPVTLFRPPYGALNESVINNLADSNMKMVMWNQDPTDWKTNSSEKLVQYIYDSNPSGAIYLLHEKEVTVESLPKILEFFNENNIQLVVLE